MQKQKTVENDNPHTYSSYENADSDRDNFQTYDSFVLNDTEVDK